MPFSRPAIVAVISAALFFLLSVPIAWGDNWPGEWAVVLWATDLRRPALTRAMQLLTFLAAARPALLISAGVSAVTFRRLRRVSRPVLLPLVALVGAVLFNLALRTAFGRFRPGVSYVPNLIPEIRHPFQRWSYPSGHAITSVVVYGALAYLLWVDGKGTESSKRFRRWRVPFLIAVMVLVGGIGFSRVYLGVHWPTDVLGGWLVGLGWLAMSVAWASRDSAQRSREW
jgi:undecaprenyl-diphosphatase